MTLASSGMLTLGSLGGKGICGGVCMPASATATLFGGKRSSPKPNSVKASGIRKTCYFSEFLNPENVNTYILPTP